MPAGGYRTFVAGEILDEGDINNYLMQGVLVFADSSARDAAVTAPVEGQFAFLTGTDTLQFYDGSAWVEYVGGLNWSLVSGTTGTVASGTYSDGDKTWQYYKFTGGGTLTFATAGYADLLVVGGGGGGEYDGEFGSSGGGGGGGVRWGIHEVAASAYTVVVGSGGGAGDRTVGGASEFGSLLQVGGGRGPEIGGDAKFSGIQFAGHGGGGSTGALVRGDVTVSYNGAGQGGTVLGTDNHDGVELNYDGTTREYGRGGTSSAAVVNTGGGARKGDYSGAAGVVVVRVQV